MAIYVHREGAEHGPYEEDDIRSFLQTGRFSADDHGWREGLEDWVPLAQLVSDPPPAPVAAVAARRTVLTSSPAVETAKRAALAGVALLFLGALCPVVSVPIVGGITFLKIGWPAYVVLALAAASALVALCEPLGYLWVTGGGALLVLGGCLVKFLYNMHSAKAAMVAQNVGQRPDLGSALGAAVLESVQLQWGCFVLGLGAVLILAGAFSAAKAGQGNF